MEKLTIQQAEETMGRIGIKSWLRERRVNEKGITYFDSVLLFKSNVKMNCSVSVWVDENIIEFTLDVYPTMRWKNLRISYTDRSDLLSKLPDYFGDVLYAMKSRSTLESFKKETKLSDSVKTKLIGEGEIKC